jgi:hypothetical protein
VSRAAHVPGPLCRALWSDARHRPLFAVRLGSDARQRDLHRAFIGAVRRGVGARQRVAFAVRPIESARQIIWRTTKAVFPVVLAYRLRLPGQAPPRGGWEFLDSGEEEEGR